MAAWSLSDAVVSRHRLISDGGGVFGGQHVLGIWNWSGPRTGQCHFVADSQPLHIIASQLEIKVLHASHIK